MNKSQILNELSKLQNIIKESGDEKSLAFKEVVEMPFEIGKEYYIQTVTFHYTGRLIRIVGKFLVLEHAALIGDTGRFHQFFNKPSSNLEVEPFPKENEVIINSEAVTQATERKTLTDVV